MIIPNRLNLRFFLVFIPVGLLALPLADFGWRLGIAALALAITFTLNALRAMGGGDAKFIAAMAPYIDPGHWSLFIVLLAFMGLAALIAHRLVRRIPALTAMAPDWLSLAEDNRRFPYALALGGSVIWYLLAVALSGR